jgi:hypothetical protein
MRSRTGSTRSGCLVSVGQRSNELFISAKSTALGSPSAAGRALRIRSARWRGVLSEPGAPAGGPECGAARGLPHATQNGCQAADCPHEGQAVANEPALTACDLSLLSALHWGQRITRALPPVPMYHLPHGSSTIRRVADTMPQHGPFALTPQGGGLSGDRGGGGGYGSAARLDRVGVG